MEEVFLYLLPILLGERICCQLIILEVKTYLLEDVVL